MQLQCTVKYSTGAYTTNTVRGCRGSSTSDPKTAVSRLAARLFSDRPHEIECIGTGEACVSTWRITGGEKNE